VLRPSPKTSDCPPRLLTAALIARQRELLKEFGRKLPLPRTGMPCSDCSGLVASREVRVSASRSDEV
jgi:hypothetical protein